MKTISWYSPKPKQKPIRLPRRRPIKTIPSGLGDKGIVGNWLFYYLKGGDHLHDFSPYGNHGTINGAKWTDKHSASWALSFDGSDDYVALPMSFSSTNIGSFSVTAWVKVPSDGGNWSILDFDRSEYFTCAAGVEDGSWSGEGGTVQFSTTDSGGNITDMWSDYNTINDGTWHYVVWVFDASTGEKRIYIDGSLDSTQTVNGVGTGTTRYGFIGDGSEAGSFDGSRNGKFYEGSIGVVRFYSIVKSASWIKRRFERTKGIFR